MANVKEIYITGSMPFDAGGGDLDDPGVRKASEELVGILGQLHLPAMGTRLEWGRERMVPNEHGGKTAMYDFTLSGREALSWDYIDLFKKLVVKVGGEIYVDGTEDMEA